MDELRAYNSSLRDWLAQKLMGDARGGSTWGKVVEGALGSTGLGNTGMSVADFTPAGMVFSGDEAARAAANGHYGEAALNVIGAVPGGAVTTAVSKGARAAKMAENLASKGTFIHNILDKPHRPFELDYPHGSPADATGKLTHDIDGYPLTAKHISGRRSVGLADESFRPEEVVSVAEKATGGRPQEVASSAIGGDAGRYVVTTDRRSGNVLSRDIFVDQSLPVRKLDNVTAHEVGHALDEISGSMPLDGLNKELRVIYNDGNNPQSYGKPFGPENAGYRSKEKIRRELVGEAFRAYQQNANYIKTVAPKTAELLRKVVREHPTLKHIIQFNSLAAGGTGAAAMMPDDTQAAAPIFGAMGGMSQPLSGQKPFNFDIPNYLTAPAAQAQPWNYLQRLNSNSLQ